MIPHPRSLKPRALGAVLAALLATSAPFASAQGLGLDLTEETQQPAEKPRKAKKPAKPPAQQPAKPPAEQPTQPSNSMEMPSLDLSGESDKTPGSPGMGLDLTTPGTSPGEFGLDLTSEVSQIDLRPTLAIIGVAVKPAGSEQATEPSSSELALTERIASTLLAESRKDNLFVNVLTPEQVREKLGTSYRDALRCAEAECMEKLLARLDAHRALAVQLSAGTKDTFVRLIGFNRGQRGVEVADVEAEGPPRAELQGEIASNTGPVLQKLSTPLAQLKVTPDEATAAVMLDGQPVGTGKVDTKVSAGRHLLRITAQGMVPFERDLQLESGRTLEVRVDLSAVQVAGSSGFADPDMMTVKKAGGFGNLWARPGFYVALGGMVALAAGAGLGASAQATAGRFVDANQDGILDVTRAEAMTAQRNALLANVLMGVGGAAIAGGAAWMFIGPAPQPSVASAGGGMGLTVMAGGTF